MYHSWIYLKLGMSEISIGFAVVAGFASFVSPCMLPVIPAFLAQLGGTLDADSDTRVSRRQVFVNTLLFVLGFSAVFAVLGVALNSVLGNAATEITVWLSRIAGTAIIVLGLHITGLIEIPALDRSYSVADSFEFKGGRVTPFVFGASFAVGWTPCVGAFLGSTFALAASQPGSAFVTLMAYSFGLGIPFMAVALAPSKTFNYVRKRPSRLSLVHRFFGFVLIGMGVLVFTNSLNLLASFPVLNEVFIG